MFGLVNRGELPGSTEHEFEQLTTRLKTLWLVEHNEDGTHNFDLSSYATIEYVDEEIADLSTVYAPLVHTHDAGDIVSGALAKARQHAQTPYKDEANTFTLGQTVSINSGSTLIGNVGTDGAYIGMSGTLPIIDLNESDASANNKKTRIIQNTEIFAIQLLNDAFGVVSTPLSIPRTGVPDLTNGWKERSRSHLVGEWVSWTPTWTNVTVGNGTSTGRYTLIGKTAFVNIFLSFGTTTAITGTVSVNVPFAISDANYGVGHAIFLDSGTAWYQGAIQPTLSLLVAPGYTATAIGAIGPITSTTPFTWVTGDRMIFTLCYEYT